MIILKGGGSLKLFVLQLFLDSFPGIHGDGRGSERAELADVV
jgi:hypothetical protein